MGYHTESGQAEASSHPRRDSAIIFGLAEEGAGQPPHIEPQ